MLELAPITHRKASEIFNANTKFRGGFSLAISVREGDLIHGIIALNEDGKEFSLAHLWTDANAQVGSLLYGAAWRVAKALGYKRITI